MKIRPLKIGRDVGSGRRHREPTVTARDPLAAVPPSRHPFQFWVMFAFVISGAGNLLTPGSEALQQGLDPLYHKIWALTLLSSSLITLVSSFWRDRITGLLLERLALITVGVTTPVYAMLVGAQTDWDASLPGLVLTFTIGVACLWRARHVHQELKLLRDWMARQYS